ncbi:MAG: anti-sigma regulatory factor [Pseudodesulfovibrio sp.]
MTGRLIEEESIEITAVSDNFQALSAARAMCARIGFSETEQCLIATAVSELATNIVRYGGGGMIYLRWLKRNGDDGIEVEAVDKGPGIEDVAMAMTDSFSTGQSLGQGLPGVKRIMDEFNIESAPGHGVRCVARKWR